MVADSLRRNLTSGLSCCCVVRRRFWEGWVHVLIIVIDLAQLLLAGGFARRLTNLRFDYLFALRRGTHLLLVRVRVARLLRERNAVFLQLVLLGLAGEVSLRMLDICLLVLFLHSFHTLLIKYISHLLQSLPNTLLRFGWATLDPDLPIFITSWHVNLALVVMALVFFHAGEDTGVQAVEFEAAYYLVLHLLPICF